MQKWIMSGLFFVACAMAIVLMFTLPSREQAAKEAKPQLPEITMNAAQAEATVKANCITKGKGGMMPSFKDRLKDEEIANVAMWLAEKK